MAVDYMKKGSISPIHYWQNAKGYIMLMDGEGALGIPKLRYYMRNLGYDMRTAETLHEAEDLQKRLQGQLKREQEAELARDEAMTAHRRKEIRDRMYARMNSSSTNATEKEFIRIWLEAREKKHDIFRKKFTQQVGHLDALEFDNPNNHIHDLLSR